MQDVLKSMPCGGGQSVSDLVERLERANIRLRRLRRPASAQVCSHGQGQASEAAAIRSNTDTDFAELRDYARRQLANAWGAIKQAQNERLKAGHEARASRDRIEELERYVATIQSDMIAQQTEFNTKLQGLFDRIHDLEGALELLRNANELLLRSTSWRISQPLRALKLSKFLMGR
jgi:hypothetical protein